MKEESKQWAVKIFICFLAAMFIMTFVSRAVYAAKLPKITYTTMKYQKIPHTIKFEGSVDALKKTPVYLPSGLRVESVKANCGDSVGRSNVIIQLDRRYLDETIVQMENELTMELGSSMTYSPEGQVPVFTLPGLRIMEICVSTGDTVTQGDTLFKLDTEYLNKFTEQLRRDLNTDILALNELAAAGESDEGLRTGISEKQQTYDEYRRLIESGCIIKAPSSGTVTDVQVMVGGMTMDTAAVLISSSPELSASVELAKKKLAELKELSENEGKVCSPEIAIITDIDVSEGDFTSDSPAFSISDPEDGIVFRAPIPADAASYVSEGDEVELAFRNGRIRLEKCKIDHIVKQKKGESSRLVINISDDRLKAGETGEVSFTAFSAENYGCIPLSIINEDKGDGYIYYVEETAGFIGKEYIVHRLDINIADQNKNIAGIVEAGIDEKTMIVKTSSKELSEGQKVRLA